MKMYLPPPRRWRSRRSRRSFLKRGLFGGLLLSLGGGAWLALKRSALVEIPTGLQVLDARSYAVVRALVDRFVPPDVAFPPPESIGTAKAVDDILMLVDPTARAEVVQLLRLFENALPNFLLGWRTAPFTQLTPDEQTQVLSEWRDSRFALRRSGFLALRSLVMAAYYGQSATWPAMRYPGPPPGFHDPLAPVWKGAGQPRPLGPGVMFNGPHLPPPTEKP